MSETLLPALLIVVPILGAPLPLAIGLIRDRVGWPIAALVLSLEGGLAAWLAAAVYSGQGSAGGIRHVLGGEAFARKDVLIGIGPNAGESTENFIVGIELVADELSGLLVVLIALVALSVLAFARRGGPRGNPFYSGYLLFTGGLMGVVLTGDLFNLFVFLEIVGLTTYALVASGDGPASAVASLKYLIVGTVGASFYLIGVGYLFLETGALNMIDVSRSLAGEVQWIEAPLYDRPLVAVAFGFIAIGLAAKSAIFPLHTWQPNAYAESPDGVTVLISALASTTSAYAFARITWTVFTPAFFEVNASILEAVLVLAGTSVIAGSVLAAMQRRVKRMFAYSSVAQFGLLFLGIGVAVHPAAGETATRFAVYGTVVHLVGHAVIKGGLFATVGALAADTGARTVHEYAGLARERPFLSGALAVLGFSLVGVPPSVGFVGKWYLGLGAVHAGAWPVVAVIFVSTVLSLLYTARLVERLYFTPAETTPAPESSRALATDGAGDDVARGSGLSPGMAAVGLGAAVLAITLGFAGAELASLLDPLVETVLEHPPEVRP